MTYRILLVLFRIQRMRVAIFVFVSILLLSSTVANIAMTVNGIYITLTNIISSNKNNMLSIYSGSASTPFTGLISRDYEERISSIKGIEKVWSELVVPCVVNGKTIIIRGIERNMLSKLIGEEYVEKAIIYNRAWIGTKAAEYLNIKTGENIIVYSLFNNIPLVLRISRIVKLPEPYDNEIIVSLETAQLLRGVGENTVSLIKVIYDPEKISYEKILEEANITISSRENIQLYLFEKALLLVSITPGKTLATSSTGLLERLGFSKDLLTATSIVIAVLLSYIVLLLGKYVVITHRNSFTVLQVIGVTSSLVKKYLLVIYVPIVFLSTYLGLLVSQYLIENLNYHIFNYKIVSGLDSIQGLSTIALYVVLFALGVLLERGVELNEA